MIHKIVFIVVSLMIMNIRGYCAETIITFDQPFKDSLTAKHAAGKAEPAELQDAVLTEDVEYGKALKAVGDKFSLAYNSFNNIPQDEGTVEFDYNPQLQPLPAGKTLCINRLFGTRNLDRKLPAYGFSIGINQTSDNGKTFLWALLTNDKNKNIGFYVPVELTAGKWCRIALSWREKKMSLLLNGKLLGTKDFDGAMYPGDIFYIGRGEVLGQAANGLIANFKIMNKYQAPVAPVIAEKNSGGRIPVQQLKDQASEVFFIYESPHSGCNVTIRPEIFKISKGGKYWINSNTFDPYVMKAEKDGELKFSLPPYNWCSISICPAQGDELLTDGSFENLSMEAAGWESYCLNSAGAVMSYGHENVQSQSNMAQPSNTNSASITAENACLGIRSLQMKKTTPGGTMGTKKIVKLQAGKNYLFTGKYHLDDVQYGTGLHASLIVSQNGRKSVVGRDSQLNPVIYTGKGQWRTATFVINVPDDYSDNTATLVFELRGATGTVYWDSLSLREAPPVAKTLPKSVPDEDLKLQLTDADLDSKLKSIPVPQVEVKRINQQPRLFVNDEAVPWMISLPCPFNWPAAAEVRRMESAGVKIQCVPLSTGYVNCTGGFARQTWLADGKYDFAPVLDALRHAEKLAPSTYIIFYLDITPYPAFTDVHPEAAWINLRGKKTVGNKMSFKEVTERPANKPLNFSYTAAAFRQEGSKMLIELGKYLKNIPEGKKVIGIHMISGSDGQWFSQHFPSHFDRSEGNRKAFAEWLQRQYKNDLSSFRKAWNDPKVNFDNITIPEETERETAQYFFDGRNQRVIDMNRFSSEGISETINLFAKSFKEAIGNNRVIVTTYYNDMMHGHLLQKTAEKVLLENPWLDGVTSVMDYGLCRLPGRTGGLNSLAGSLRLHNKLFITEMDYRTDYSWLPPVHNIRNNYGVGRGDQEIAAQARRDAGAVLTQGAGLWLYSIGSASWGNANLTNVISEAVRAAAISAQNPVSDDWGQMAVFVDERMQDYMTGKDIFNAATSITSTLFARNPLLTSGIPFDGYLLSDLVNPERSKYKLNIFLSAPTITQEEIRWVKKNMQKDGNVLVFVHAAGISLNPGFEANIQDLTGIRVKVDTSRKVNYNYAIKNFPDTLAGNLKFLQTATSGPLFYIDDQDAIALAALESDPSKIVAAVKRHENWTAVYLAFPGGVTPGFLRDLANEAGIVPIGPQGDITHAGNGFISIHAASDGMKTLHLREKSDLYDLFSNQKVASEADTYSFEMKTGTSQWFRREAEKK